MRTPDCSASAFNTLTDSIARFQREAAHKDRLTSLGRLSTVIAHEIRNPLMIIRASLASLWSEQVTPTERREALADIDEETRRLNRIVTEVLDFSKPIRFELGETQVNDVCRASSAAAWAGSSVPPVELDLDPRIPPVMTDAERLRTALVNILTNARHAVEDVSGGGRLSASRSSCAPVGTRAGSPSPFVTAEPGLRRRIWPTSSTPSSPRAAPAPAWGCPSRKTSSTASVDRSRWTAGPTPAPKSGSSCR